MSWLAWLVLGGFFLPIAALWLGGMIEPATGNGFRQVLGLLLGVAVFLVVWAILSRLLTPIGPVLGRFVLPTLLALVATPGVLIVGYRLVGIRLHWAGSH